MTPPPAPLSLASLLADFPALSLALKGAERAARSDVPILIQGEPGTGRSTIARALHFASPRAAHPLTVVDPAAVPSSLFESELFGYRAGSFTGAAGSVDGRIARSEGGTVVLDQIEELPLLVQPKLLRLLAERRYTPLGGQERAADVRFVTIASDELQVRVTRGTFRPDLLYRLEVVAFHIPPLRDRREDLAPIVDALLADLGERFGRPSVELSPQARAWMLDHPWPGNLRQLRNVLERALVLAEPDEALDPPAPSGSREAEPRPLTAIEREQILAALAYTRGHQGRAAGLLGISRKALWEKRRRYGIP